MANPRKFSEKIALHHQKQAEETAAFEQIMREVSDATNKVVEGSQRGLAPALGPLRAGSLPDVSQVPAALGSLVKPDDATLAQYGLVSLGGVPGMQGPGQGGGGMSPGGGQQGGGGQGQNQGQQQQQQQRGRPAGVGPMRARPQDRKIDTSPYGSTAYLSPPPDCSWRRTNSDSALHQSSVAPRDVSPQGSPHHHHNHLQHHHGGNLLHHHQPHHHSQSGGLHQQHSIMNHSQGNGGQVMQPNQLQQHHYSHSHHGLNTATMHHHSGLGHRRDGTLDGMMSMIDTNPNRPRSSCEVPRVPGINIYPSAHDSGVAQIPVSSNTGSLPDLTSVHFPPAPTPLCRDRNDENDHIASPYSTSPVSASPATLSPTSLPPQRSGHSPHHSPRSSPHTATGSPTAPTASTHPLHYSNHHSQQNHLSVPNTNRYPHHIKGPTLESTWIQSGYQQQCSPPSLHSSHSNINLPSPTMGVAPAQVGVSSNGGGGGYRSPHSPGSSPGGGGGGGDSPHYDASASNSYSNPTASATNTANDNYFLSQALQQHFEQFSMMDNPPTSHSYINNVNTNQPQYTQSSLQSGDGWAGGGGGGGGGGGCSGSPQCIEAGSCCGQPPCPLPPHPNTPTIPDIILTDFSNPTSGGDMGKELSSGLASQFSKELSASMNLNSHFDTSLFPEDEGLRDGLGPLDFDGFQMLTDPEMNIISDPSAEDNFRL